MTAFPIRVAPKKVQKGTKKWPQVIPARSNRGLGIWINTETQTLKTDRYKNTNMKVREDKVTNKIEERIK
jgi:hypothetical protein